MNSFIVRNLEIQAKTTRPRGGGFLSTSTHQTVIALLLFTVHAHKWYSSTGGFFRGGVNYSAYSRITVQLQEVTENATAKKRHPACCVLI